MNAKILTLTVFGDEKAVREVIRYTRSSTEMRSLMQKIATRRIAADCSLGKDAEFRAAHAAAVSYARRLARARGCWTYNAAHPTNLIDVGARAVLATVDMIRQTICTVFRTNP